MSEAVKKYFRHWNGYELAGKSTETANAFLWFSAIATGKCRDYFYRFKRKYFLEVIFLLKNKGLIDEYAWHDSYFTTLQLVYNPTFQE
jgi:hypothetical protein